MPGNLAAGKLPAAFLRRLFAALPHDPAVVLGAAIGEDAAVIDLGAADLLVAKTDPITLATEGMGRHLLAINGNDFGHHGRDTALADDDPAAARGPGQPRGPATAG